MAIVNKFSVACIDCGCTVAVGQGLSERRETLNLPGSGWVTRHDRCSFVPKRSLPPRNHWLYASTPPYDDYDDYCNTMGMTESEFFGGDVGDKG